jgi:hypothetical protein
LTSSFIPPGLQIFAASVLLGFWGWVLFLIRKARLSLRDSLAWLFSTTLALILFAFPIILKDISNFLQVEVPSNALFAGALLYVLFNLLVLSIANSHSAARIRRLTQEYAIIKAELEQIRSMFSNPELNNPDKYKNSKETNTITQRFHSDRLENNEHRSPDKKRSHEP